MNRRIAGGAGILALVLTSMLVSACSVPSDDGAEPEPSRSSAPSEPSEESTCPDHTPGVHDGSVQDPYYLGDEVSLGCFTVVVDDVDTDATDAVIAANPGASPIEGHVYMTATLTITRASDGPGDVSDITVVLDDTGGASGDPLTDLALDPPMPTGTLEEGATVTGTYIFEITGGAATSVELAIDGKTPVNVLPY